MEVNYLKLRMWAEGKNTQLQNHWHKTEPVGRNIARLKVRRPRFRVRPGPGPSSAVRTRVTLGGVQPTGPSGSSPAAPHPQRGGLERQREPAAGEDVDARDDGGKAAGDRLCPGLATGSLGGWREEYNIRRSNFSARV